MRDDARQLRRDDPQHGAAFGDLDPEETFRAECEGDVVPDRVEVVLAIGPRDDLVVLPVLPDLLEAAVQVADVGNASHDGLAVELEHQPEYAVRRGVLRADVDQHVLAAELGLEHRGLLDGDRRPTRVGHQWRADGSPALVKSGRGESHIHRSLRGRHAIPRCVRPLSIAAASRQGDPRTHRRSTAPPSSTALPDWPPVPDEAAPRARSGRAGGSPSVVGTLRDTAPTSEYAAGRGAR